MVAINKRANFLDIFFDPKITQIRPKTHFYAHSPIDEFIDGLIHPLTDSFSPKAAQRSKLKVQCKFLILCFYLSRFLIDSISFIY